MPTQKGVSNEGQQSVRQGDTNKPWWERCYVRMYACHGGRVGGVFEVDNGSAGNGEDNFVLLEISEGN